jgi:hypothetical protein
MMNHKFGRLVLLMSLFLFGSAFSSANVIDPNEELKNWLQNNNQAILIACQKGADIQAQQFLRMNPLASNQDFINFEYQALSMCLYGVGTYNLSVCAGQLSDCQSVLLLIPTLDQVQAADAVVTSTPSTSNFY